MTIPCRILVPTDYSPVSDAALDYAWLLARRVQGTIDLLHVLDPAAGAPRVEDSGAFLVDSVNGIAMQRALSEKQRLGGVDIRGRLETGEPREAIVRIASTEGFDLVVMGQRARESGARQESDSLARQVAHAVRCPVIKVRSALERQSGMAESWKFHRTVFNAA
jgi:nucleotide-binding universal stress UspA family protein